MVLHMLPNEIIFRSEKKFRRWNNMASITAGVSDNVLRPKNISRTKKKATYGHL